MPLVVRLVELISAGILAGVEVAIHYTVQPSTEVLDDSAQLRLRQALIRRLRVLVPACFLPMAVSAIAIVVLDHTASGVSVQVTAIAAVIVWAAIRVVGTVPINSATLTWQAESPPPNWKARVHDAERFHVVGVWAVVVVFLCAVASIAPCLVGQ